MPSHFHGPLLGSEGSGTTGSGRGLFKDLALGAVDEARSNYITVVEGFHEAVADTAAAEVVGWTQTNVDAGTAVTTSVLKGLGLGLSASCGTVNDGGTSLQLNAAPVATKIAGAHKSVGPITSTTTLMDGRELIFYGRLGLSKVLTSFAWDSKAVFGWCVTDTALMTAATGALALATGGGIGFHFDESGNLNYFTQATTAAVSVDTGMNVALTALVAPQWWELGFRARWTDAGTGTGTVDFYVNGKHVGTVTDGLPMQSTEVYSVSLEAINGPASGANITVVYLSDLVTAISKA